MNTALNVEPGTLDVPTIVERVRAAGIVGAGGAGFPTHVKLQAQVEIFLVNAAECEPMLKVDQQLMAKQAARLIRGVQYAMKATGARERDYRAERKVSAGDCRPDAGFAAGNQTAHPARRLSGGR